MKFFDSFTDLSELGNQNDNNMMDNSIYSVENGFKQWNHLLDHKKMLESNNEKLKRKDETEETEEENSDDNSIRESCISDASSSRHAF